MDDNSKKYFTFVYLLTSKLIKVLRNASRFSYFILSINYLIAQMKSNKLKKVTPFSSVLLVQPHNPMKENTIHGQDPSGKNAEQAVAAIVENHDHSTLMKLQKFNRLINRLPDSQQVQTNPYANQSQYLPISFVEMSLDEVFFGQWSLRNFRYHRDGNELLGSLELEVVHPITGRTLIRTGAAAVQVPQERNTSPIEFDAYKRRNAFEQAFPKLKALCLSNAAASIGKQFGRDLNRRLSDTYQPLIPEDKVA